MAKRRTIGNILAPWRFITFVIILVAAVPVATLAMRSLALGLMTGFDIAAAIFLILCVPLLWIHNAAIVHDHAKQNDANRTGLVVLTALVMIVLLAAIGAETMSNRPEPLTKAIVIATLFLAWLFSNLVYAFHYAHLAYRDGPHASCAGLNFPGDTEPVYWDFIYFAFTLGMTFQTSDVDMTAGHMRRVATFHCLAAFVFNIGILAFSINVLGGG